MLLEPANLDAIRFENSFLTIMMLTRFVNKHFADVRQSCVVLKNIVWR